MAQLVALLLFKGADEVFFSLMGSLSKMFFVSFLILAQLSWAEASLEASVKRGEEAVLVYPVETSPLKIPEESFRRILRNTKALEHFSKVLPGIIPETPQSLPSFFEWLGLAEYREDMERPQDVKDDFKVGASILRSIHGTHPAMSFSCASCHASEFFGRTVMGLPNKGIQANTFFVLAKKVISATPPLTYKVLGAASSEETSVYKQSRQALRRVASQKPLVLGLDTSLSHVGRSLARRKKNEWADFSRHYQVFPRSHQLDRFRADSKPGVWWNLKHKDKFLLDGSVVSGSPIATNIIWNEIGRGADLRELDTWLIENQDVLEDIENYLSSLEAPQWEDFFGVGSIDIKRAQQGEKLFQQNCMKCHGRYEKNWEEGVHTQRVHYPSPTPVIDVGTDPSRFLGMRELSQQLNALKISQKHNIKTVQQNGYVPPPLEGIWARYPYFHNNSIPSLCALLDPDQRPSVFYSGPAKKIERDFDENCVGLPLGAATPEEWKLSKQRFDTSRQGLGNQGHTRMLFNPDGSKKFSASELSSLIEYLKTL